MSLVPARSWRLASTQQRTIYPPVVTVLHSLGTTDTTPDQWHRIHPYASSLDTRIAATAFHMGAAEHSDDGFILAGPRHARIDHGGDGFSADGSGTFASFYHGPEAACESLASGGEKDHCLPRTRCSASSVAASVSRLDIQHSSGSQRPQAERGSTGQHSSS